ncbi:M16 family metallopeptidase [Dawidia soli]|uniref:Insulinase family protein n=1 Tax=Dawidia soli TaxID=2782352 RepID=A0AAP2DCY4_9BACT|nr:pitrilysin family protein [Dawidia soli]MBT1689364.1 insulinase family protein [Dawidia soli]
MRSSLYVYTLALTLLATGAASAQKQSPPPGGAPHDFKLPAKKVNTLPNGLRSTLVEYGVTPKVTVSVIVKTGNVHEGANEVWLADFTGKLINEGSATLDAKALAKKVALMGGELNISTGLNQTTLSGSVLSEYAPDLIKVLADVVIHPAFPAKEVDRLKNDLKRGLSVQKSIPQSQAFERFGKTLYPDQPYGRYFPTEAMLDSYTLENAKAFYDKNFGAQRTVVYVVGKFDEDAVTKAIDESFTSWQKGPAVDYPVAKPAKNGPAEIIDRPGAPQTTVMLGLPVIDPSQPDYLALQVTNTLLGGSFISRITSNIREDKGYTYSPYASMNANVKGAYWAERADVTTEHTGASLQEISKEIKRLQTEPVDKKELEGIQNFEAGNFVLQNSTPNGIINQLNFIDLHGLSDDYLNNRVKNIYAVTPEKIQSLAREYFKYENMTLVLVGDKKQLDKQMKSHEEALKKDR